MAGVLDRSGGNLDAIATGPSTKLFTGRRPTAVTPSDTVDLPYIARALQVGGAGVVAVVKRDNTVVNFTVPAGGYIEAGVRRVNSTNTTATLIVALY